MKICMLSTGHGPLDDRIYHKEVESLKKRYSDILVIAAEDAESPEPGKSNPGTRFILLKKTGSLFGRLLLIPRSVAAVIRNRPDICHFHEYELIFVVPFLRLFANCKIIYDVHEVYPEMVLQSKQFPEVLKPVIARLVDISEKLLVRFSDVVIAADNDIALRFNGSGRTVMTIFNYPRLSLFVRDEAKTAQIIERYKERVPIIYHGGMSEERGLFNMIRAMHILKRERPEIILLLVGSLEGQLRKEVEELVRGLGLKDHVDLVGEVPHHDVVNYVSVAKLGLIPFLPTEKFKKNIPVKQFEYMACGVPILGADLPPISSYVLTARCGRIYNSTSFEALAREIPDMLKDEAEWSRMSEAGKRAVRQLWNWDLMEERLFSVYDGVQGGSTMGARCQR